MKDLGLKLLYILKEQRKYFVRTTDGEKIITNNIMFNSLEEEALRVQEQMGRENKKLIIQECKARGWKIPNFKKEGINK